MKKYKYVDKKGTFQLENPELTSYLYFPIANDSGVLSCVTPTLGGDSKLGQNTFLLEPVSSENLHNNKSSRNFWCQIKGGSAWSATGNSAKQQAELFTDQKEETCLEAGIMWHKVTRFSKELALRSTVVSFVPATSDLVEFMIVTIQNEGNESVEFIPTAAIPIYGRSADNIRDHRHVTSLLHRIETTRAGVIVNPTLTFDERGHQKNQIVYGVFGKDGQEKDPVGFYPCVETFIGEGGSFEQPKVIIDQFKDQDDLAVSEGYELAGYEAMGGIRFEQTVLAPGECKTYKIVLGYGSSKEELENTVRPYLEGNLWEEHLKNTSEYWENKITIGYESGKEEFDAWMHWVNFQPMLRRIYGCSFLPHHDYGKGGRGWRDLWQDCLALLLMNPAGVRSMLLDNFGGVRFDGTNATIIGTKQGEFIADRNNITRVWMDHGAWPWLTMELYVMQTGDLEILLEETAYFKDMQIMRGSDKDLKWNENDGNQLKSESQVHYQGTILEHILIQHATAFYDVGEHNHMKLHGADWNDALDMAKERGESVAFTNLYAKNLQSISKVLQKMKAKGITEIFIAKELTLLLCDDGTSYDNVDKKRALLESYCNLCRHQISGEKVNLSMDEVCTNLLKKADWIQMHIRKTEWVSDQKGHSWYNGYYDNAGNRVEGIAIIESNLEGTQGEQTKMLLTSQVFSIMSETASKEQVAEIVKAVDNYLYEPGVGGYRLNTDFKEVKMDMGRMFGFAYGTKENGAVFSHMAIMYANALYQRKFVKEGFQVIDSLFTHCSNFETSRIYPGVPEYIGDNGRGLYHYLTGAASWLLLTVLTQMYGVKGYFGDLLFDPKILRSQFDKENKIQITSEFANRKLIVEYCNDGKKEYGEYQVGQIMVNGETYLNETGQNLIKREDIVKLAEHGTHKIVVFLT